MRRLLVIAGDRAEPAGPFHGALEAIDSGLISRSGISEIGISGYPDGHPRIADHELDRAARREARSRRADRAEGQHRHAVLSRCRADHRLGEAPARSRHRSSGAHRACRADQPHDADALRQALRRARLDAGARAQCRADQAPARRLGAGRRSSARWSRRIATASSATSRRICFRSAASARPRAGPRPRRPDRSGSIARGLRSRRNDRAFTSLAACP